MDPSVKQMIEAAQRVFYNKGAVVLHVRGEKFLVKAAELSEDETTILAEAHGDEAEITIRAASLDAVSEVVDLYR